MGNQEYLNRVTTEQSKRIILLESQLRYYETHIPRMRELKKEMEREQAGLKIAKPNGNPHGIIGVISR